MRKYQPLWLQIKKHDKAVIILSHPRLQKKVRQGVILEKHKDVGFRILNDYGEHFRLRISYDPETLKMTFVLHQPLGIREKVVG